MQFGYRLATGCWLGSVVAVSFLVAPTVFRGLPRRTAGEVMGQVFSGYYWLGAAFGTLALVCLVLLALRSDWGRERRISAALLALMVCTVLYARLSVVPELYEIRAALYPAEDAQTAEAAPLRERMDGLHTLSVRLNGGVLLGGIALMWLGAARTNRREKENGHAA
ncbi:MAG: DUF4149 domain-containing protein [Leptospirillia bacterium]